MKRNILLFLFTLIVIFSSCRKNSPNFSDKKEEISLLRNIEKPIEVHIDLNNDCLPFDSLMNKVNYVKLETTVDNLIGEISQLLFVDDKIIIVDAGQSKTITVYNEKGHYLYKIGAFGQGPMEYGALNHVAFTPGKEMLVITDLKSGRLKYYSIDGHYVKSVKLPYWFSRCEFITDNLIAGF